MDEVNVIENVSHYETLPVSYSTITDAVKDGHQTILDSRGMGRGKTYEAGVLSQQWAESGINVIIVMPNYKLCTENAAKFNNEFVFKGKPQEEMCQLIKSGSNYVPISFCEFCDYKIGCGYQTQFGEINNYKIVFSVREMLPVLLNKVYENQYPIVICDDVSITSLVYNNETMDFDEVNKLKQEFSSLIKDYSDTEILVDLETDLGIAYYSNVQGSPNELYKSLTHDQKNHLNKFIRLLDLYIRSDNYDEETIYGKILFEWQNRYLAKYQLICQSATPTSYDMQTLQELSRTPICRVEAPSYHNDNWIVLALQDTHYTSSTSLKSQKFQNALIKILAAINFIAEYSENKCASFSSAKFYDTVLNIKGNDFQHISHFIHYGTDTSGSNALSDNKYSVISGILFPSEDFVKKKPYNDGNNFMRPESEFLDNARWEVGMANVKQEIGRTMRWDGIVENEERLCVLMSDIPIQDEDGYVKEIGCRVIKLKNLSGLIEEFRKRIQFDLKMSIINYIKQSGESSLEEIARDISIKIKGIYGKEWVKKEIENSGEFVIEERKQNGRGRPAKYIVIKET